MYDVWVGEGVCVCVRHKCPMYRLHVDVTGQTQILALTFYLL